MDALIGDVIGDTALVLIASALLGALAQRFGQPAVVGQIFAGILLGPTLLGRLPGHLTSRLFPNAVIPALTVLSQVAVVIFMFVVGYELDRQRLREQSRCAVFIAIAALAVPMALGSGGALIFQSRIAALDQRHLSHATALFIGVALSITALPVLAAIIRNRGLSGTLAAVTATSAAGLMDVAVWLLLALTLAGTAQRSGRPWLATLALFCAFAVFMALAVRPALRWWLDRRHQVLSSPLPVALVLALGSAWVTAALGLHPVFGGFLAGLTMPHSDGPPDADVLRPMESIGGVLLPLFFVVTGLSLDFSAIDGTALVTLVGLCLAAAIGKLVPAYGASRLGGLGGHDAATVAVLVNTRGLTELIALNLGFSAGIIGRQLYTVLVLMALAMTVLTGPLLSLLRARLPSPPLTELRPATPRPARPGES
jgi:Kef-type K+ transport system membrane component KefB